MNPWPNSEILKLQSVLMENACHHNCIVRGIAFYNKHATEEVKLMVRSYDKFGHLTNTH